MLADAAFLGMVGPYNSGVALDEIPVAAPQHFTMVSPSNTNPCLTKNLVTCPVHPQKLRGGNPNNYFRVAATDDNQSPSMADYAFLKMNLRRVGVLDDSTARGVSHANAFEAEFTKLGGTTMRASYRKDNTHDWTPILLAFRESGAAGVYAGGDADQNICMSRRQMKDIGWVAPFLGWEGIIFPRCIDDAAANSVGMYFTNAVPNAPRIPGAASAIAAFQKAFPGPSDLGFFTMDAYDATNMLVRAIERAIGDAGGKMPSREQVRAEMAKTKHFVGVMGTYSFDQNGDTTLEIMSVYTSKQVNDPSLSIGVCGSTAKNICYTWVDQFDFAKTKA
jgi:branched-chain amino acid transport system substrate-binding protein